MKIAMVTPHVSRNAGGLFLSVRRLSQTIATRHEVTVHALRDARGETDLSDWRPLRPVLHAAYGMGVGYGFSPALLRSLSCERVDVIHVHGIRMWPSTAARLAARHLGVPLVVSPRGQMSPWMLARNRWRKRLVHWLTEDKNLRGAAIIHVASTIEAEHIRAAGIASPLAVIPNGIDVGPYSERRDRAAADSRWPALAGKRALLFLSNIHPTKGLDMLARAWDRVADVARNWVLVVAGTGDDTSVAYARDAFARTMAAGQTVFVGAVYGPEKRGLLAACDLFVLPTRSDSFANVVAEALAAGLPVITTKAAPWAALVTERAGWWVDVDERCLRAALEDALAQDSSVLDAMGARGRAYVQRELRWDLVADEMIACYSFLVRGGAMPPCLCFNA